MATTTYTVKSGDKFNPFTGQAMFYSPGTVIYGDYSAGTSTGQTKPSSTTTSTSTAPKTTTSTSGTTSSTSTTSAPKPTGINVITSTLNVGSQGDQVKALQQYLAGLNFTNADGTPLKVDGIYGSNTKNAVMQFQSQNGLVADGVFGPKSLATTKTLTSTAQQATTPLNSPTGAPTSQFNTGDPGQDALLKELQNYIQAQQAQGLKLNKDLNFDEKVLSSFLESAKKQVHPFYQQQIDTIRQDVLREAPQILQNYGSDIAAAEGAFKSNLGQTRENFANQGMAYSGFRGEGEKNLLDSQNRSLQALNQQYGNSIYNLGRGAEKQIGASNMNFTLPSLGNYSASLSGQGGFTSGGTVSPYSAGGYKVGSIEYDKEAATEARRQALLSSAQSAVVAGRSYSDLLK